MAFSPQLKIISPVSNQTILGDKVTLSFIVGNIRVGKDAHLHLWLDTEARFASSATEITSYFDHILSEIPPGIHNLTLEVVKGDHQSFTPAVLQTTQFTTQLPASASATPKTMPQNLSLGITAAILIISLGIIISYKWGRFT